MVTSISPLIYQALVIRRALLLYAQTGIKANSAYTPSAMMRTAQHITGRKFKQRDYLGAAQALLEHVEASKADA